MKYFLLIFIVLISHLGSAQERGEPSVSLTINGFVKQSATYKLSDSTAFKETVIDSLEIYNHEMKYRKTLRNVRGVLLKEVLDKAGIKMDSPKNYSEIYFTCTATDGYMVVFSWNELYNTIVGKRAVLITSLDGKQSSVISLISAADEATGRRYVYNISTITVNRGN